MSVNLKRQLEDFEEGSPPAKKPHLVSEEEFYSVHESPAKSTNQSSEPNTILACYTTVKSKDTHHTNLDLEGKSQGQVAETHIKTDVLQSILPREENQLEKTQDIKQSEAELIPREGVKPLDNTDSLQLYESPEAHGLAEDTKFTEMHESTEIHEDTKSTEVHEDTNSTEELIAPTITSSDALHSSTESAAFIPEELIAPAITFSDTLQSSTESAAFIPENSLQLEENQEESS